MTDTKGSRKVATDVDERADPPGAEEAEPLVADIEQHVLPLAGLDEVALAEHVERYQRMHAGLQAALTDIDGA